MTGTGFVHIRNIWMRIASILGGIACVTGILDMLMSGSSVKLDLLIALGGVALLILFEYLYAATKTSIFEIAFAGGGVGVDVRWFNASDVDAFQKRIKQLGDELKQQKAAHVPATSAAAELSQLGELLEKGLFSPEEFELQKRKLL